MRYLKHWITSIFMVLATCTAQTIANTPPQYKNHVQENQQAQYPSSYAHNHARNIPNLSQQAFPTNSIDIEKKQKKSGWRPRIRSMYRSINNRRLAFKAWLKKCWSKHPYLILIGTWAIPTGLVYAHGEYEKYMVPIRKQRLMQKQQEEKQRLAQDLIQRNLKDPSCPVCFENYNDGDRFRILLNHRIKKNQGDARGPEVNCAYVVCITCEQTLLQQPRENRQCPLCRMPISTQVHKN